METAINSAQVVPEINKKQSPPRIRSIAYPSYNIRFCYDLTLKIHQTFGSTSFNTREEIGKQLNVSAAYLMTQVSSCVQYGLLEIKHGDGYKPTQLFTKIYKPLDEQEKQKSLLECFLNPELYKLLINQFNNQSIPLQGGLETILLRNFKVSESGAPGASKIFLENLTELKIVDSDNILRINNFNDPSNGFDNLNQQPLIIQDKKERQLQIIQDDEKTITYVPETTTKKGNGIDSRVIPIYFKDGSEAQVILPNKFTNENLAKVLKILTAYIDD